MHRFENGTDLVSCLRELSELGPGIHAVDWKQIVVQCASAAKELEKLRRTNEHLLSCLQGISKQTNEMVKANS